jgi:hypothetical protein
VFDDHVATAAAVVAKQKAQEAESNAATSKS